MRSAFGSGLLVRPLLMCLSLVACGHGGTSVPAGPMPEGGSFNGVFFSPQYGEMHMVQNGNAVVGRYKKDERYGEIQGEADGSVMRFEWSEMKAMVSNRPTETRGHGYFKYLVDPSSGDHVLKGRWGLGDDDTAGGEWNAYKSKTREPDLDSIGPGKTEGGEAGGSDKGSSDEGSSEGGSSDDSSGGEDEDEIF